MSRLLKELLATAAMMACETSMLGKTPYHTSMGMSDNPNYTPKYKLPVKELREFTIKGKTIMATSRKDAIKKYIININSNENTIQNTDVAAMDYCVSQYGHRVANMSCDFPCDIPCHREGQRALLRYVYKDI